MLGPLRLRNDLLEALFLDDLADLPVAVAGMDDLVVIDDRESLTSR